MIGTGAAATATAHRLADVRGEIERLKAAIEEKKASLTNGGLRSVPTLRKPLGPAPSKRKTLSGHYGKVHAMSWSHNSNMLISAGQDSKLIMWDAYHGYKLEVLPLKVTWAMACAFNGTDSLMAWGGMDNTVTLCDSTSPTDATKRKELHGHDGYVSCVRFNTPGTVLSSSGDSTCILWDASRSTAISKFSDHAGDVLSLTISPENSNVFISCSIDSTAKVWDIRSATCVQTFVGHDGDINCVEAMPSGVSFGTGGEDAAVLIFDMRSCARLNEMIKEDSIVAQASSLAFSRSGRVVFAGHDDCNVYGWDTLEENPPNPIYTLGAHTYRVSCLGMNHMGEALCTGSWDTDLVIWA